MSPIALVGSTVAVSAALPATVDRAGFEALAFTQIRGVRSAGEIGQQYQTITDNTIGAPRPYQRRVGLAAMSLPLELVRIADDGQSMLRAAIDAPGSYSFRLTRPDGSRIYFTAAVSSRMHGGFSASSIADTKCMLEIDSLIVEVD